MFRLPSVLSLTSMRALYAGGATPTEVFTAISKRVDEGDPACFISRASMTQLQSAIAELLVRAPDPNSLPLWGVPFAAKDNIDAAGFRTTAACPAFDHVSAEDATVVARLRTAGAILLGKTNLDQFATGLNGTRSPYGAPRSVFDARYISGGSSSGSAVAVASGVASFSLGTDTAGSGRVPAAFNNIVGIKPTPGLLSSRGVVPACRSLDCISIFGLDVGDAAFVRRIAEGFDPHDPYSRDAPPVALPARLRVGVLTDTDREFFGDRGAEAMYGGAIARIEALGHAIVPIDYTPFAETARLLYDGPWVAERTAAFDTFGVPAADVDPTVLAIIQGGRRFDAIDLFRGHYELAALQRRAAATWAEADVLLLPTTPTTYTVDAMRNDPVTLNSRLGLYTNFFNLMGLSGIAIPAGFRENGLPHGVTLAAPGFADEALVPIAALLHGACGEGLGRDRGASIPASPSFGGNERPGPPS